MKIPPFLLFCLLVLGSVLLPLSAQNVPDGATGADQGWPLAPTTPLPKDDEYRVNSTLLGLSGRMNPDAPYAPWQGTPEWKTYSSWLDNRWAYIDRVRLSAMRVWAAGNLGGLRNEARTVYYPFSGPDVLYVDTYFPDSKYLLMAGLEPVGVMPDLAQIQEQGHLGSYLERVKTSLFTILAASFFKTKDMKNDFNEGLLPAIAVFLGHQGDSIDSIQYVRLQHDGTLVVVKPGEHNGVQITYYSSSRDHPRVLLYFRTDLGNDGVKSNPGFVNLMRRIGPGITYLKAASYLLHEDYFSSIQKAILENSVGVLQDDSGLPLRAFGPDWTVTPYGKYSGPINLFSDKKQPDMTALFAQAKPAPLSFGSGYKFQASESSLIVAQKKH